ncbi:DUF6968 family protein [Nocardia seriolae]|uniref:DUF6968 domain-containing protein n=1 Tax=Nocardia seriolae TaxID=37332 RepID=A0ABC9YR24_9NOCA|nr:hypothetical protein [Nocardia seriolae]WKY54251.1 hypothetical protein Q5P07_09470 [Nocardia seriolae]WNJ61035.1 hypothetical protein RMO66_10195 [Nocardia seriolae]GAM45468.1 hypothetical protein NS07_v2contig00015-0083 [Nocardia seriolae]GAP27491.1 hypothetical protein NSK11_contig00018-0083 [Nocardia seriolae]
MPPTFDGVGEFGEPIATRELVSEDHGGSVVVALGAPRPDPDRDGIWLCPWRIDGIGETWATGNPGRGTDSWQALTSAITIAMAALEGSGHPVQPA